MSRSAADATRFTATGPYASSKSGANVQWPGSKAKASSSTSSSATGVGAGASTQPSRGPPGETPKQKVERLRAEARRARIAKSSSPADRILERGRVWADRAHRITIFSLIAASGVAGILTIYSLTSLVIYNRRQKTLWVDRELQRLVDAKKAYVAGNPSDEQLELLQKEKVVEDAHRKKEELKKQTYFYKAKETIFGGLSKDEGADGEEKGLGLGAVGGERPGVMEAVNAKRMEDEAATAAASNEKQMATHPVGNADASGGKTEPEAKKSWSNWILRR